MHTGHYISGAGHLGLIGWALLGPLFTAEPLPFEVQEVSVITGAEYAALVAAAAPPESATEIAEPSPPQVTQEAPAPPPSEPDTAPERSPVPPVRETPPDATPEAVPAPPADAEVADEPPEIVQPSEDVAVLLPRVVPRPRPRPAERVAPRPVAQPEPERDVAPEVQPETAPAPTAETPAPETEATAPEAASTEIVTEAEEQEPSGAPERSVRPRTRPARRAPPAETAPAPPAGEGGGALAAALAEAQAAEVGTSGTDAAPSGPPLSQGEREAMRVAVQECWVVDVGSQAANVTVTLAMRMTRDGKVEGNSLRLLSSEGGDAQAAQTAFQAARRAVLRCQKSGYKLPIEKYDHWREIEMTFNPENMRLR